MASDFMLSTIDNPYDPYKEFSKWFIFDSVNGYNSCDYLGRIVRTTDLMSDQEISDEISRAIDEIIKYDFENIYKKVRKPKELLTEN
jgi:hypothetical protein